MMWKTSLFWPVSPGVFDTATKSVVDFVGFGHTRNHVPEADTDDHLMTIGAVAKELGVTTQHVRDLCDRGFLSFYQVGSHRRIKGSTFNEYRSRTEGGLPREQQRSLWFHHAIAGKLVANPDKVIARAQRNPTKLRAIHPTDFIAEQFDTWDRLLAGPVVELLATMTSQTERAIELRQTLPLREHSARSNALAYFTRLETNTDTTTSNAPTLGCHCRTTELCLAGIVACPQRDTENRAQPRDQPVNRRRRSYWAVAIPLLTTSTTRHLQDNFSSLLLCG